MFENVNNISDSVKLTREMEFTDYKLPFPDCLTERIYNNLKIDLFRKLTYFERYLDYGSAHVCCTKVSVVKKLIHRISNLITERED